MQNADEPAQSIPALAPSRERKSAVVTALRAILPGECVLSQDEELRPYECDGLTAFRQMPVAVVLPRTERQISEILAICRRLDVPVVARGSGTGLSGGAMPHAGGVILCLARLNQILELDPVARTARVQRCSHLQVSEAAAPYGLYYAPDPPRRSRAPLAATWRRTRAACTA